jgi:SSS family solute:Na+ symporter
VVGTVAVWQLLLESGWSLELLRVDVAAMVTLLLAASGFIAFRFRETRALTLAQFYEMRYTRRVRIFAGLMIFISGVVNFGIFPAVGSRFFLVLARPGWRCTELESASLKIS